MTDFVNHVNPCLSCEQVPEMERKSWGWLVYCPECGMQFTHEDSIEVIKLWNQDNPEHDYIKVN